MSKFEDLVLTNSEKMLFDYQYISNIADFDPSNDAIALIVDYLNPEYFLFFFTLI